MFNFMNMNKPNKKRGYGRSVPREPGMMYPQPMPLGYKPIKKTKEVNSIYKTY